MLSPTAYLGDFPAAMTTGDYNGDGDMDIVVSQPGVDHGQLDDPACLGTGRAGEVYVYAGGPSLIGSIPGPDTAPAQLMHLLRYTCSASGFGKVLSTIPRPRPGDNADWLYAKAGSAVGLIYKGSDAGGGIVPRDAMVDARIYPVGGPSTDYLLDVRLWSGVAVTEFGGDLAVLGEMDGMPGVDIALAPQLVNAASNEVFIYSYSEVSDASGETGLVRRAILDGGPNLPDGYGYAVAGVSNYAGLGPQLVVSTWLNSTYDGMLYLYR